MSSHYSDKMCFVRLNYLDKLRDDDIEILAPLVRSGKMCVPHDELSHDCTSLCKDDDGALRKVLRS
jgi:hypothetical protein